MTSQAKQPEKEAQKPLNPPKNPLNPLKEDASPGDRASLWMALSSGER